MQAILLGFLKCLDALDYRAAASFATEVLVVVDKFDGKDIHANRIKALLQQLSETLIDWSVTNEIESKKQ